MIHSSSPKPFLLRMATQSILAALLICFASPLFALKTDSIQGNNSSHYTPDDITIFNRLLAEKRDHIDLKTTGQALAETALFFLDSPYVGATLEGETEQLTVNLRQFDCMTLVESTVALTLTRQQQTPTFESYCQQLQQLRYRQGEITDYTDRLHYTTDWLFINQEKGMLTDITQRIGGQLWQLQLSFMSTHPNSYKPLEDNPARIATIQKIEETINARDHYYIPKEQLAEAEAAIQDGDIIGFVTGIEGLDISHVGIAYRHNGVLTFIHASSTAKKVIINEESLQEYLYKIKRNTGIVVARMK